MEIRKTRTVTGFAGFLRENMQREVLASQKPASLSHLPKTYMHFFPKSRSFARGAQKSAMKPALRRGHQSCCFHGLRIAAPLKRGLASSESPHRDDAFHGPWIVEKLNQPLAHAAVFGSPYFRRLQVESALKYAPRTKLRSRSLLAVSLSPISGRGRAGSVSRRG